MPLDFRRPTGFLRRNEGSVAIIFGLVGLLAIGFMGFAIDYGRISLTQARLQDAADSAVLNAASKDVGSTAPRSQQAAAMQSDAMAIFKSLAAQKGLSVSSVSASTNPAPGDLTVTLQFAGSVPSTFGQLFGVDRYHDGGTASASLAGPKFIDIYLVVDISASMGIGATPFDQLIMNKTFQCNLACHSNGTDALAHQVGATLRMDVVINAIRQVLATAQENTAGKVIRFSLITYGNTPTTLVKPTPNLTAVRDATDNIQLAGDGAGTNAYAALQYVKGQIQQSGDGSSADKPVVYVILATDGVDNSTDNSGDNITGKWLPDSNFQPPYTLAWAGDPFPHAVLDPTHYMQVEGFDPAWCNPLKSMGVNVMTLDMRYTIPTAAVIPNPSAVANPYPGMLSDTAFELTDPRIFYIQQNLLPLIPRQMTRCASQPDWFMSANSPPQIKAAMQTLFLKTLQGGPRLTN